MCIRDRKELVELKKEERTDKIALFNLYSIKAEVNRVKQAIREGRLWEYTMKKARSHPKLFETIDIFTKNTNFFIDSTPRFKQKAIFLFSKEDQFRPEILAFHDYVRKFRTKKKTLVITPDTNIKPAFVSKEYAILSAKFKDKESMQFCNYNPFLGLIPIEISDIYPASHYVMARNLFNPKHFSLFLDTWKKFFEKNNFEVVYTQKNDEFLKFFRKFIPKNIKKKSIN